MKLKIRVLAVLAAVLLCLLAAGCDKAPEPTVPTAPATTAPKTETQPVTQPTEPTVDMAAATLHSMRQALLGTEQRFAVAYLGFLEEGAGDPVAFVGEHAPRLCADLPFLTAFQPEDVVGTWGEVYCIVPAEGTAVALYTILRDEYGWESGIEKFLDRDTDEPFLLLCNSQVTPEIEVVFTAADGEQMGWQPRLNHKGFVHATYTEDYEPMLLDFSDYTEQLAGEYRELLDAGWTVPTAEDLVGTSWRYEIWVNSESLYIDQNVLFQEDTAYVRWYDMGDENYEIYDAAPWTLEQTGDVAVLTMDFGGFAGERSYNVLLNKEYEMLFFMVNVLTDEPVLGDEILCCYMDKSDLGEAPEPMEMVGTWQRLYFEVEGYREDSDPGDVTVVIAGDSEYDLTISYTEKDFPEGSYENRRLLVEQRVMYEGCGNSLWLADVLYLGLYDTEYSVTLLADGRLLLASYWTLDGAPMVSYEWFSRVE